MLYKVLINSLIFINPQPVWEKTGQERKERAVEQAVPARQTVLLPHAGDSPQEALLILPQMW